MLKNCIAGKNFLECAVRPDREAGVQFTKRIGLADSVASISCRPTNACRIRALAVLVLAHLAVHGP
jgi:hypothetical protein